jgi:polar amino acid transport system substrate-binding protein
LQPKYPAWKGKDSDKYVDFDIDLGEQIGECLDFRLDYKAVTSS